MLSKLFWLTVGAGLAVYTMNRPKRPPSLGAGGSGQPKPAQDTALDESPNAAERLQQSHAGGAYAGLGALLPDGGQHAALLPASGSTGVHDGQPGAPGDRADENDEKQPSAPGLGETFRGA